MNDRNTQLKGLAYGVGAYLVWGLAPVWFKALKSVAPTEILSHRIVWSVVFLVALIAGTGKARALVAARPSWRRFGVYAATTSLITGNWLLYIWAVNSNHLLEASLGYFINPLVNVLLGVIFLRERLSKLQLAAVAIAAFGVLWLVLGYGRFPWISLTLATTFGTYGLLRKKARVEPMGGLLIETALVTPLALALLGFKAANGTGAFVSGGPWLSLLLAAAGVITATPLVWFSHGVNRLKLSTMGLLQYIAPTCQFLLAVLFYGEAFTSAHGVVFASIWLSLALYTVDAIAKQRAPRLNAAAAAGAAPARVA